MRNEAKIQFVFAQFLERCSDADIEGLIDGSLQLEVTGKKQRKAKKTYAQKSKFLLFDPSDIIEELNSLRDREAAYRVLEREHLTKSELSSIGKELDMPIMKNDSRDQIIDKIIEGTIGYKLRSATVQGTIRNKND